MRADNRIYSDEDLRVALLVLLLQAGGSVEVGLEAFGEAMASVKFRAVAFSMERTAQGIRVAVTEPKVYPEYDSHG